MTIELRPYLHMRVCDAIRAPGPAGVALIHEAEAGERAFTYTRVRAMLAELDACQLTIADWIAARADWI